MPIYKLYKLIITQSWYKCYEIFTISLIQCRKTSVYQCHLCFSKYRNWKFLFRKKKETGGDGKRMPLLQQVFFCSWYFSANLSYLLWVVVPLPSITLMFVHLCMGFCLILNLIKYDHTGKMYNLFLNQMEFHLVAKQKRNFQYVFTAIAMNLMYSFIVNMFS